jgi:ribosomal protein L6P/L9E
MQITRVKRKRFAFTLFQDGFFAFYAPLAHFFFPFTHSHSQSRIFFPSKAAANSFFNQFHSLLRAIFLGLFVEIRTEGVGFKFLRFPQAPSSLCLSLGHSCNIIYNFPTFITFRSLKYRLLLFSPFLLLLSNTALRIRSYRPADPYKGKGLKFSTDPLKLKPGKQRQR